MSDDMADVGSHWTPRESGEVFDYIVVGSGAGGGPVAARLARAGFSVLLLEAGGRAETPNYSVPAFHPFATEDPQMRWDYYVRHYANDTRSRADPKFCVAEDGVLYPRAGTLGGCTAHHALISIVPHDSDWDWIAEITGDESWAAPRMRRYFQRLERKRYNVLTTLIYQLTGWNIGRHGYGGWLPVSMSSPTLLLASPRLLRLVIRAALKADYLMRPWLAGIVSRVLSLAYAIRDINGWSARSASHCGVRLIPVSVERGFRHGTRELIDAVHGEHPDRLQITLNALVSEILLDTSDAGSSPKAVGVRYLKGARLYDASAQEQERPEPEETVDVFCRREVILSAGAFNTPQILMLSGIGDRAELERHDIPVRCHRPGVGRNLQDRYEVGIISRMKEGFAVLDGARYRPPQDDEAPGPLYAQWLEGKGPYNTNGGVVGIVRHSDPAQPEPDLFCFGLLGAFRGYYPGYSKDAINHPSFTWAILKAHTENRGGRVSLVSADPRSRPHINFHYFEEGSGDYERDVTAVVEGIKFCRTLAAEYDELVEEEVVPGPKVESDAEIAQFVRDHAWGHHASCTCAIGRPENEMAVVDSEFRVIGTRNLRVVDASVFPRIPGIFIVTPIYMIAEKAAEAIISSAKPPHPAGVIAEREKTLQLENKYPLFRVGAVMLILGSILAIVTNLLHPNPHDIGDPLAQLVLISQTAYWGPVHVGIVMSGMIQLGGLVALTASFTGGYGAAWARTALSSAIVGAAASVVLFAIDGIASQRLAIEWAQALPGDDAIAYRVAQSNQYVGFAVSGLWIMVFFGLTYIAYGLAVATSREYPRWLGWVAVAGGVAGFAIGYFQYFYGLGDLLTNKLFPGCAILLALWTIVMGSLLWRRAEPEDGS